jgi:hypothetical protein
MNKIILDEKTHRYYNTQTNEEYISVSAVLEKIKKPFDTDYHANRVGKRDGIDPEYIKSVWADKTVAACDQGSAEHNALELYFKEGIIDKNYDKLITNISNIVDSFNDKYYKHTVHSEKIVYSDEFKVAGTVDLILEFNKYFLILDFKTNEKFDFSNKYNEKLLSPVEYFDNCKFNVYALQLSLYAHMLENSINKPCKTLLILYIKRNHSILPINVNYLKYQAQQLLWMK